MKKSLIQRILEYFFGFQYFADIINVRGTDRCEVTCYIFHTCEEAQKQHDTIRTTLSFDYVETISFRSHRVY